MKCILLFNLLFLIHSPVDQIRKYKEGPKFMSHFTFKMKMRVNPIFLYPSLRVIFSGLPTSEGNGWTCVCCGLHWSDSLPVLLRRTGNVCYCRFVSCRSNCSFHCSDVANLPRL